MNSFKFYHILVQINNLIIIYLFVLLPIMTSHKLIGAINKRTNEYTRPKDGNKNDIFECFECKNPVIFRSGKINQPHFAHNKKYSEGCNCYNNPSDEQIHKNAILSLKYLLESNIQISIYRKCINCENLTYFDIPIISHESSIVDEYRFEYNGNIKIADVAYLTNKDISYIFEIYNTHKTNEKDRPEPWFEIDASKLIDVFNGLESPYTSITLECIKNYKCDLCFSIDCSDNKIVTIQDNEPGIIYFNQRGAGCGKTYESIQNILNPIFSDKTIFIYLTKMHTAKDVIYDELIQQEKSGRLSRLSINKGEHICGKQYTITFINNESKNKITVIIGTIDSFNYAVVDKQNIKPHIDYFKGIVQSIINGYISTHCGQIKYARGNPTLNKKCLITIDEFQDISEQHINAFEKLLIETNIDVYCIGDELQSLWGKDNAHTHIKNRIKNGIENRNIISSEGINIVMRFHNHHFIDLVNSIIPYDKYNLPKITGICNGEKCKYKRSHNDIEKPYVIFQSPTVYSNDHDYKKIDDYIDKIIEFVDFEVNSKNYLPNNFMFIFPILTKNPVAELLLSRLQLYWIDKFNDIEYINNILNSESNNYWKDKIGNDKTNQFVYLHKSDEGKSINLKESEHASKILSIHASKGNGCEVVFVLGVTERSLNIFSKQTDSLVFDSLLHVAITRQKERLYVGIECNGDEIHKRFTNFDIIFNDNIPPNLDCIRKYTKLSYICDYVKEDNDEFKILDEHIITPNRCIEKLPIIDTDKNIIDFGHHITRYSCMFINLIHLIISSENMDNESKNCSSQYKKQLFLISKCSLVTCDYFKYNFLMRNEIDDSIKEHNEICIIPILSFSISENTKYYQYTHIIKKLINHIQIKICNCFKENKFPILCPLECVILLFLIKMFKCGTYSDMSIMDVYSIIESYESCCIFINEEHTEYNNCICSECFINSLHLSPNKEMQECIVNHYDKIEQIRIIFNNYNKYITDQLQIKQKITYNIHHKVWFGKKNENFSLCNEYPIIGYSDKDVVFFIIKPQFTALNFNNIMVDLILYIFTILNVNKDENNSRITNFDRYTGKIIHACIITLDSDKPIFYTINIDKCNIKITNIINKYLYNKYSTHHELIYKFYEYYKANKPNKKQSSFQYIEELFKVKEYSNLPKYIKDFFSFIKMKLDDCGSNKIMKTDIISMINNKYNFIQKLNELLQQEIVAFLNMEIDGGEDCDY